MIVAIVIALALACIGLVEIIWRLTRPARTTPAIEAIEPLIRAARAARSDAGAVRQAPADQD